MNATAQPRLLIVDDEAAQMTALCNTLEDQGYVTTGFTSANEALAVLRGQEFDLLLTDLMMPEMDGIALLRAAQDMDTNIVGIVMTAPTRSPTTCARPCATSTGLRGCSRNTSSPASMRPGGAT
jgi:CheY-like chemotaxis protein